MNEASEKNTTLSSEQIMSDRKQVLKDFQKHLDSSKQSHSHPCDQCAQFTHSLNLIDALLRRSSK